MVYFKERRMSLVFIILSILGLIFSTMAKNGHYIHLFNKKFMYYDTIFYIFIFLAISIILFIYSTDNSLENAIKSNLNWTSIKSRFSKIKNVIKSELNSGEKPENTEVNRNRTKEEKKIRFLKNSSLILGVVLTIAYFAFNSYLDNAFEREISYINLNTYDSGKLIFDSEYYKYRALERSYSNKSIAFNISIAFFGLIFCGYLARYNRGNVIGWIIFGFLIPYLALILAGLDYFLKEEYKDKLINY